MVLPERYQELVERYPIPAGKLFPQGVFRFFRRLGLDITPYVANPVDVRVHAYSGKAEPLCHKKVGGLAPYSAQCEQFINVRGNPPVVFLNERPAYLDHRPRLVPVKTDGVNERLHLSNRRIGERLRVVRHGEKAFCGLRRGLVFRPQREQATYEHVKPRPGAYIVGVFGDGGLFPPGVKAPQDPKGFPYVEALASPLGLFSFLLACRMD